MTGKILKSAGGTLVDLLMGGARGAGRNVTPEIATSIGIARNALSNVSEIPLGVAQKLRLEPASSRIAREAYGGSGLNRGTLFGTTNSATVTPQAVVPEFPVGPGSPARGFRGSSTSDIISGIPVQEQLRPGSMPKYVRPSAAQSPAPVPKFKPTSPAPTSVESVAQELNRQRNNAAALAELRKRGSVAVRPTGTTTNTVQRGLDLRNPAGSVAQQPYTTSRGIQRPAGGSTGGQMYNTQAAASPSARRQIAEMTEQAQPVYGPAMDPRRSPGQGIVFRGGALAIPESIAPSSPARLKVGRSLPIDYPQTDPGMIARRGIMRARRELKDIQEANRYVDASLARRNSLPFDAATGRYIDRVIPTNEGAFLTNLSDPSVLAALGVGGAAGLGAGTYLLNKQQDGSVESPTRTVESPTRTVESPTRTVESNLPVTDFETLFELLKDEKVTDTGLENSLRKELEESLKRDVKTDTPTSVIRTNEGSDSIRRQNNEQYGGIDAIIDKYTEPMSPEKYSNIADYYRDRDNYASQDSRKNLLAAAVAELAGLQSENMRTWAQTHPGLAYQLLERQGFNAPETLDPNANASVPGVKAVSELGSNSGESARAAATGVSNSDLLLATQPRINSVIEKIPLAIQQRIASQGIYS